MQRLLLGAGIACSSTASAEELAAPRPIAAPPRPTAERELILGLPDLPSMPAYVCVPGMQGTWSQAQTAWCCEHMSLGCTATETSTTTGSETATSTETETETSTTSTSRTSTTVTTTTVTCDETCEISGMSATCRDQIQQLALTDFLGNINSCELGWNVTATRCPICAGCPAHQGTGAGCGILEATTTSPPPTTMPKGGACNLVCLLGDQPATCSARILWSKDNIFLGKPKACVQAHAMVLGQCPVCGQCKVEASACEDDPAEAQRALENEELFDCSQDAPDSWSGAKASWCCEHHKQGCDVAPQDKKVFFQRKVLAEEDTEGEDEQAETVQVLPRRGRALAAWFVGAVALSSIVGLFARSSRMARRRQDESRLVGTERRVFQVGAAATASEQLLEEAALAE